MLVWASRGRALAAVTTNKQIKQLASANVFWAITFNTLRKSDYRLEDFDLDS